MSEPNNDRQHLTDHTLSPALAAKIPFKTFPADHISDDKTVEDRIQAAVLAERVRKTACTDAIAAIIFEPGKSYVVLVAAGAIDPETLAALPPGPDCTFIFVMPPPGLAVWEIACRMEINPGSVIFVEDGCISEDTAIDGAKFVRVRVPPEKKLRDVLTAPDSIFIANDRGIEFRRRGANERCAKIAASVMAKEENETWPQRIAAVIRSAPR